MCSIPMRAVFPRRLSDQLQGSVWGKCQNKFYSLLDQLVAMSTKAIVIEANRQGTQAQ